MGDHKSFRVRFIALRKSIMDDAITAGVPFKENDLQYLASRLDAEGSSFAKVTLPLLGKSLDQGLVSGHFSCPSNFSLQRNTRLPRLCLSVFQQIFTDEGDLRFNANSVSISALRQFLLFDSKLLLEPSTKLKDKTVQDFKERMQDLRKFRIPTEHPVLIEAKNLIKGVLKGLDLSDIEPGHGPGSVAENLNRFERWEIRSWPVKAEKVYPYIRYGIPTLAALVAQGFEGMTRNATTRICLVPKDFKGPRLISAETTVNQFLQQGQMRKMMKYIRHHWLLSRSIRLDDQTFNQNLAMRAFDLDLATVDLSNASDTISVPLFWYLFSGVPKLRSALMRTRSDFASYQNEVIRITSFAPMGSATCFPVETIIFWALAMASVRLCRPLHYSRLKQRQYYQDHKEIASEVAAFGDDIILPNGQPLETFLATLRLVGCSPNMSKTCWKTPFRESCGSEWYNGIDVTIIRNRQYDYTADGKILHYPVLLDLQRKFFLRGYKKTAALLCSWAREIYPIFTVKPSGIKSFLSYCNEIKETYVDRYVCAYVDGEGSCDPTLPTRYNRNYQRHEARLPVVVQLQQEWGSEGYARLFARLLGDRIDRVAHRDRKVKRAWRVIPFYMGLESLRMA